MRVQPLVVASRTAPHLFACRRALQHTAAILAQSDWGGRQGLIRRCWKAELGVTECCLETQQLQRRPHF